MFTCAGCQGRWTGLQAGIGRHPPNGFSACSVCLFLVLGLECGEERDHVTDVRVRQRFGEFAGGAPCEQAGEVFASLYRRS